MADRRTLGDVLMDMGRIDQEDVSDALAYQEEHGGYFGEALLALGVIQQEELEWGLASQFDLPYVFPEAESIDPEAAALVSPEWALAHLTLPITMTEESLTVVVDSPIQTKAVDELSRRTDKRIDLALASASKIRELIRRVHSRAGRAEPAEPAAPVTLPEAFGLALEAASDRFGVSVRDHRAWFWWDDAGTVRRRPLEGTWTDSLDTLLSPTPADELGEAGRGRYTGHVSREGMVTPVEVRLLAAGGGREYLFRPVHGRDLLEERFTRPPPAVLSEVQLLARSGSARFVVSTEPAELGGELLPNLPVLLLDPSLRSVHLHAPERGTDEGAFAVAIPAGPEERRRELESLRTFRFDVVTVDLPADAGEWDAGLLDVAPVAFVLWEDDDRRPVTDAGVRWELGVRREEEGGRLSWSLEALHP